MEPLFSIDRAALMALAGEAKLLNNAPERLSPGALAGERVSRQQGRGLNFEGLRRYQAGDDVRLIDWQATARLRTPWIRLYNEERERPVFLLIDQRLDMYFTTRGKTKSVAAAMIAGLFAWRSWHDSDRLGAVVFSDEDLAVHPCRSPKQNLGPVLEDISRFNQALVQRYPAEPQKELGLAEVLQQVHRLIPPGAWLAMISDFHDLDTRCEAILAGLRRRCEVNAFVVYDDLHLRLPTQGTVGARYQGLDATVSLSTSMTQEIQRAITQRLADQEQRLSRLGARVHHIVTSQDLVRQLQKGA
ncbi:DUF58 domain-containing protein [Aeromonas rivuli]|jgi:uncharacterized protein (DUF58 family)|uniref:DUF58 domain-containing protein n=1 Tax=Aeromonas rivuli TaxID=648794 RepID=UPI001CCECF6F|nr:DUF58 domain-containing protein [Aeromonas rivuli]UBO75090.1 DUF58 domain-containing protein [Aeromonas rivuli]